MKLLVPLSLLTLAADCSAIDAVLKADISTSTTSPARKLIPDAPRLRIGKGHITSLKFDAHAVVPAGITADEIAKAVLKIWVNKTRDFSPGGIEVYGAERLWEEREVSRYGIPTFTRNQNRIAFATVRSSDSYVVFDVTSAVKGWFAGQPNNGFVLTSFSPLSRAGYIRIYPDDPYYEEWSIETYLNAWLDSKESKGNEPTLQLVLKPK